MSAEFNYAIKDDGSVAFAPSGHVYRVRRFARGAPAVTVVAPTGEILTSDRLDPFDAKARTKFVATAPLNGRADVVLRELILLAELLGDDPAPPSAAAEDRGLPYEATPDGLVWFRPTQSGTVRTPLTNFTATIVADIAKDDGVETTRAFELAATLNGKTRRLAVPADRFASMGWATEHLGANALIYPGFAIRDHAQAAIQVLSGEVPERRIFGHLGWRELDGHAVYLHAAGATGADGPLTGIAVELPDALSRFVLPEPVTGDDLVTAIRASLRMLDVMPDAVTIPVFGAIWRAVIGEADFSLHLTGQSGEGKTEVAALAQQHWGGGLDARHLPTSWLSTGNAVEGLAFAAKDTILTVDDFVPTGTVYDAAKLHREADRVFRAQGNRAGRQRMRADATQRAAKPPRGLIVSTGEDVPRGQSLRGRLLILEVPRGRTDWARLTACQRDAAAGRYAQALVGFIRFVAQERAARVRQFRADVERYRTEAHRAGAHRRTPGIVADLAAALRQFIVFAEEAGAMDAAAADAFWTRCWAALGQAAAAQPGYQAASEPTWQFRTNLASAISAGEAHIADIRGGEPFTPSAWGWRLVTVGSGEYERQEWRPQGKRVGWLEQTNGLVQLYLDGEAAFAVAQDLARRTGDAITVTSGVFRKRLKERQLLASTDEARETLTVRKTIEGGQKAVLHVVRTLLDLSAPTEPDKPDSDLAAGGARSDAGGGMSGRDGQPDIQSDTEHPRVDAESARNVGFVGSTHGEEGKIADPAATVSGRPENSTPVPTANPTTNGVCMSCGVPLRVDCVSCCADCERDIWGGTRS